MVGSDCYLLKVILKNKKTHEIVEPGYNLLDWLDRNVTSRFGLIES